MMYFVPSAPQFDEIFCHRKMMLGLAHRCRGEKNNADWEIDLNVILYNILFFQMSFGIAVMLPMDQNIRFGLLCVACVPGGGLGHVAVIISQSDIPLSLTINLIGIVAMLGKFYNY